MEKMEITLLIIGVILLICGSVYILLSYPQDFGNLIVILALVLSGVFLTIGLQLQGDSYKQGQIDAINGKIQYKLIIRVDSTKIWVPINQNR